MLENKKNKINNNLVDTASHFAGYLESIIGSARIGFWDLDISSRKTVYSKQYEQILGYDEGEAIQLWSFWANAVWPEDLEIVQAKIDDYLQGRIDSFEAQFRITCKDGSLIWAQNHAVITERDEKGKPLRVQGIFQDISAIKATEEQLSEKRRQFDFVAKISGLVQWTFDIAGNNIFCEDAVRGLLGWMPEDVNGSADHWISMLHPDDQERARLAVSTFTDGSNDDFDEDLRAIHKKGYYVWVKIRGRIVEWGTGGVPTKAIGGLINIDKLKKTTEQLHSALEKNESYNKRLQGEVKNAVKNLEEAHEFNQILFDSNPDINVIFNDKFQMVDCNPAAIQYFGFSSKEEMLRDAVSLVNEGIPKFQSNGDRSLSLADRFLAVLQEGAIDFETEISIRGVSTVLRVIFKKVSYRNSFIIACYAIDLRLIREAKNELRYQDKILKTVNMSASRILISDTDDFDRVLWEFLRNIGQRINVNRIIIWKNFEDNGLCARQLYEWFEGVPAQRDKRPMQHLVYEEDAPTWLAISKERKNINCLVKDLTPREQARIKARGAVSVLGIPLFFKGEFWGFISFDDCKKERVFTDQEESILHSASILIISAILKNDTTLSLIKSREDAVAGSKAKSDFLSRMSHEIRTPMNAIIGMTTIAKRSGDVSRIRYCLDKVDGASKQLLGLINDILDMSKIEADKFEVVSKEFNFEKIVQNAVNVMQVKLEEKHQQIVVDFDKMFERLVISDDLRLSQVLLNLLSNANKFTPDDGRITVKIRQTVLDKEHVKLHGEVIDTGIGISPEQQARLFNSFEQADSTITRRFGGTGLGLALCKRILNLMGGDIWIQSELGKGAAFIFELDVALGGMIGEAKSKKLPPNTRVLVIDDSDDVREYFSHILAGFSIACDTEASGKAGFDSLRKAVQTGIPYNIVFLDWKLPGENCVEVAKAIQGIAGPTTALVLMSVADWADIEPSFQTVKINRFLTKPMLPSTLYDTIVNVSGHISTTEQQADPVTDLAGKLTGRIILVAEDIEINQEILASILEGTGVSLEFALNGVIAIEMFKKKQYDLVLMDMQMPELDGLGATRAIRLLGTKAARGVPIIAMTANAFNEDVEACLKAGMNGHLAKPIDVDELMEVLGKWLL